MSLQSIRALVDCDSCGKRFTVELDPADKLPPDWTLWDAAEDAVREGQVLMGEESSVRDGKMLCAACTREGNETATEVDPKPRLNPAPTRECPTCGPGYRMLGYRSEDDAYIIFQCPRCRLASKEVRE